MKAITEQEKTKIKEKSTRNRSGANESVYRLAALGLLTAITFIMGFTPIGYIPIGALKLTFMTIPVIIAAAMLGPTGGAVIGGMFGLTSFIQAFSGMSLLTGALFQLNPILTFLLCVVPRVLEGWLGGLIFKALDKIDKTRFVSYVVTSLSVPVMNTLFFMSALYAEIKIIVSNNLFNAFLSLLIISFIFIVDLKFVVCLIIDLSLRLFTYSVTLFIIFIKFVYFP